MVSKGTADNMALAVARLTETRGPLRLNQVDPFAAGAPPRPWTDADDSWIESSQGSDGSLAAIAPAAAPSRASARTASRKPRRKAHTLTPSARRMRLIAAPLLILLALALTVPAVWSILVFAGAQVALSDHDSARKMAGMMLVCWPLAGCLGFAGAWLIRDLTLASNA